MIATSAPRDRGLPWLPWLVGRPWFWACFVGLLFGLPLVRTLRMQDPAPLPALGSAPRFSLTREGDRAFGSPQLLRHVWVAGLFQGEERSPASRALIHVAKHTRDLTNAYYTVSLASGPTDDRARLDAWATKRGANPRRFVLLSGRPEELARVRDALGLDEQTLVLVDPRGVVRGRYTFTAALELGRRIAPPDQATLDQLLFDVGHLINAPEWVTDPAAPPRPVQDPAAASGPSRGTRP